MAQFSSKINILLVDDRPENLISLDAVLRAPDYNLVKAASGDEALKRLLDQDFALILLDVQMPNMDGFETATLIKMRERSRHIPIIFVTAISKDEPYVFKGYSAGAVDYVFKPYEPSILRSKVAVFADLYRKTEEIKLQAEKLRIQERLERERALAQLELESLKREQLVHEKYRDLVEGINHGIVWSADADTMAFSFVSSRAREILGYPQVRWLTDASFWANAVYPDDQSAVADAFRQAVDKHTAVGLEHRLIGMDGEVRWFHTGVRPSRKADGVGVELRGLSVDVTHMKRTEAELQTAVRSRDEFLSIASHELKTPLTPLRLQIQGLRRLAERPNANLASRLVKMLDMSDRQVDRLGRLVDELLDVARINNGNFQLQLEEVDLGEVVKETISRFSEDAATSGCTVHLNIPEKVVGSWDRLRIEQVFTNLLTNAFKYAPGKPVEVTLTQDEYAARMEVRDHGQGIHEKDHERIFKRFERAAPSRNFGGLGLGLYIVGQILKAHHGKISLQSAPGEGATFIVELPRLMAAAVPGLSTERTAYQPAMAPPSAILH